MPGAWKLHSRTIIVANGRVLRIVLNADQCRVDEPSNRVILGFADGDDEYAVSMRRRAHWDITAVAGSIERAIQNGNLEPSETSDTLPFDLDIYSDDSK